MSITPKIYAASGINWEFVYEVILEEEEILVLKDLGRFHKFDEDRMFTKEINKYIEIFAGGTMARVDGKLKLVEIQYEQD